MFYYSFFRLRYLGLVLILHVIDARPRSEEVERGNAYVDKLLQDMLEEHGAQYDPYVMEDNSVGFSRKVAFVNVTGEAKLFNGRMTGLKTLHRVEDCSLTEKEGRLYVSAELGVGPLEHYYEGTVKFMNLGPTIKAHGEVKYVKVQMYFSVDSGTGKDGKLHKFTIDDLEGMKAWITGLGPINWAVNPVLKGVTLIFKRIVRKLLENRVEHHIRERLPNYQFPVEGITESTSITDESTTEAVTVTESREVTTEEPETEEPETDPPEIITEEPDTEEPETEEPETEPPEIITEEPDTEEPETEEPEIITEEPDTEEPETEEPETEPPEIITEEPDTEEPETEEPEIITEEPETDEPETEPPEIITEEPDTEEPEVFPEELDTEPPEVETEEPDIEEPEEPDTESPELLTEEPDTEVPEEIFEEDDTD